MARKVEETRENLLIVLMILLLVIMMINQVAIYQLTTAADNPTGFAGYSYNTYLAQGKVIPYFDSEGGT